MMFGHVESVDDRIEHLRRLRDVQDETGGFTAFICWTFQSDGTKMRTHPADRLARIPAHAGAEPRLPR